MKNDILYPYYLEYLESKVLEGKITKSYQSLLKISLSKFNEFKFRFESDELFSQKIIEIHKSEERDKKIDDIFDDIS